MAYALLGPFILQLFGLKNTNNTVSHLLPPPLPRKTFNSQNKKEHPGADMYISVTFSHRVAVALQTENFDQGFEKTRQSGSEREERREKGKGEEERRK